uniref:Uncharacterized protein n=1 Tax=Picea glauca TaxID=3330 RepID=A0A124GP96_PICGL|nr:hypothetical protein ABT39_MTgene1109 [Picea glauca]QHR87774.1 hypothetical protein Q903MT_gene1786 [Picea sitchensis]
MNLEWSGNPHWKPSEYRNGNTKRAETWSWNLESGWSLWIGINHHSSGRSVKERTGYGPTSSITWRDTTQSIVTMLAD